MERCYKKTSKIEYEKNEFKLPAVLPIVIYNGKEKWTATKTLVSAFFALDQNMDWAEFLTKLIEISQIYKELKEEDAINFLKLGVSEEIVAS